VAVAKARTGTIAQQGENRWRLQVTPAPDPLIGSRRRLSETVLGTRREADRALQHLIEEAGARVSQETNTVATLLDPFMNTASLAATTRADWQSLLDRHVINDIARGRSTALVTSSTERYTDASSMRDTIW
jgi:hypothetical protein